jgi:hypothetical protein
MVLIPLFCYFVAAREGSRPRDLSLPKRRTDPETALSWADVGNQIGSGKNRLHSSLSATLLIRSLRSSKNAFK